jgi:dUTP pyrophosphatase
VQPLQNNEPKVKKYDFECEVQQSDKCKKIYLREYRDILNTKERNDNTFICLSCSRFIKNSGRSNPNCKYIFDDGFMTIINTERKAYLLGWIASDGSLRESGVKISIHEKDEDVLKHLRDTICEDLPISKRKDKQMVSLTINSTQISEDVCNHLGINAGKKDSVVKFPELSNENLQWHFIRGYFDGDGSICPRKNGYPRCNITSNSTDILEALKEFCNIPCSHTNTQLEWVGINSIDFLGRMYKDCNIKLTRKYEKFVEIADWKVNMGRKLATFSYVKTCDEAFAPSKSRTSDSGYDLHLIKKIKVVNNVHYFDTGIKIRPELGYYFDLVGRSSISKTGWMLANNIGIIDNGYSNNIIVALVKINENSPELELPIKLVQLIPRPLIIMDAEEVDELDETERNDGGFGSTDLKSR